MFIETGFFHIKKESFVTIEKEVTWIIQESKSIFFRKKKISMIFSEMVSQDSANCLDRGIRLKNRNPCSSVTESPGKTLTERKDT